MFAVRLKRGVIRILFVEHENPGVFLGLAERVGVIAGFFAHLGNDLVPHGGLKLSLFSLFDLQLGG